MVKRAVLYDGCQDGSRLLAEWSQTTPANWSVFHDGTRFSYRCSAVTEINTLMSMLTSKDFEIYMKIKSHVADGKMGIFIRKGRNTSDAETASVMVWFEANGIYLYVYDAGYVNLLSTAFVWTADQWYEVRTRVRGETFQAKIWALGTAEPDWLLTTYLGRISLGGKKIAQNAIALRQATTVGNRDFADIRVYPIPKVSGGMAP